jgi:hypothetical protein
MIVSYEYRRQPFIPYEVLVQVERDLRPLRVIATIPKNEVPLQIIAGGRRDTVVRSVPYGARHWIAVSPGGRRLALVTADYESAELTVVQMTLDGDTTSKHAIPFIPRRVPPSFVSGVAHGLAVELKLPQVASAIETDIAHVPPFFNALQMVQVTDDGDVWLCEMANRKQRWRLMNANGTPGSAIIVGATDRILAFAPEEVWIETRDTDNVPIITGYRLSDK